MNRNYNNDNNWKQKKIIDDLRIEYFNTNIKEKIKAIKYLAFISLISYTYNRRRDMKRFCKVLLVLIIAILVTGCNKSGVKKCTVKQTTGTYTLQSDYEISYKGKEVTKVKTIETIETSNSEMLKTLKDSVANTYKTSNEKYGGYSYESKIDGNKLIFTTTIDYAVMDLTKFAEDNTKIKQYLSKNNKFTIDGITTMYKALGAECK